MENDVNRRNLIFIIIFIFALLLVSVLLFGNNSKDKNSTNSNDNDYIQNTTDTTIDDSDYVYKSYSIGDVITLIDSSNWHVVKNSTDKEDTIILLKDEAIPTMLKIDEAESYLSTDYYKILKDSLSALSDDILTIRLLSLEDIKNITGNNNAEISTITETNDTDWLFVNETLTSIKSTSNYPMLICEEADDSPGKLCEKTEDSVMPVRPVVVISKDYIK